MSSRRPKGFLSKTEREYLEFLEHTARDGQEVDNKESWDGNTPYRHWDHKIRWKTKQALRELCLVFEKVGYSELRSFFSDLEVLDNLRFLNQTVEYVEVQKMLTRLERETS